MVAQVFIGKGGVVPLHRHESEQISYILKGALKFELQGTEVTVHEGEVLHIPSPLRRYWDQFLTSLYGPDQAGSQPSADARHRALELVHGRRRVPFPADVP